jgi:hypothetical protein
MESFYLGSNPAETSGTSSSSNNSSNNPRRADQSTSSTSDNDITPNSLDEGNSFADFETPRKFFHVKFIESQQFLNVLTDLYLRLANPVEEYDSNSLMPGFDDDSMMERCEPATH